MFSMKNDNVKYYKDDKLKLCIHDCAHSHDDINHIDSVVAHIIILMVNGSINNMHTC